MISPSPKRDRRRPPKYWNGKSKGSQRSQRKDEREEEKECERRRRPPPKQKIREQKISPRGSSQLQPKADNRCKAAKERDRQNILKRSVQRLKRDVRKWCDEIRKETRNPCNFFQVEVNRSYRGNRQEIVILCSLCQKWGFGNDRIGSIVHSKASLKQHLRSESHKLNAMVQMME